MGVEIVHNNLPQCAAVTLSAASELSTGVAREIHQAAQNGAPVLTGALRNGIQLKEGNPAEVTASSMDGGATREYATYNEYGTRYMAANPFMAPAAVVGQTAVVTQGQQYGQKIEAAA